MGVFCLMVGLFTISMGERMIIDLKTLWLCLEKAIIMLFYFKQPGGVSGN